MERWAGLLGFDAEGIDFRAEMPGQEGGCLYKCFVFSLRSLWQRETFRSLSHLLCAFQAQRNRPTMRIQALDFTEGFQDRQ
jgi:hypothetical protein